MLVGRQYIPVGIGCQAERQVWVHLFLVAPVLPYTTDAPAGFGLRRYFAIAVWRGTIREGMEPDGGNRMSRHTIVGLTMVSFALLALACINLGGASKSLVGEPAPAFGVQYQSRTVTLDDLKGKVVVVIFWSST